MRYSLHRTLLPTHSKHIDVRHHFIREQVGRKEISIIHVPPSFQHAAFLTKAISQALLSFTVILQLVVILPLGVLKVYYFGCVFGGLVLFFVGDFRCAEGIPGNIVVEFGFFGLVFFFIEDFRCAKSMPGTLGNFGFRACVIFY